jgi:hypothetical protein
MPGPPESPGSTATAGISEKRADRVRNQTLLPGLGREDKAWGRLPTQYGRRRPTQKNAIEARKSEPPARIPDSAATTGQ